MITLVNGKFIGVYQRDNEFYARFLPDPIFPTKNTPEFPMPISKDQFHSLPLNKNVQLKIEISL